MAATSSLALKTSPSAISTAAHESSSSTTPRGSREHGQQDTALVDRTMPVKFNYCHLAKVFMPFSYWPYCIAGFTLKETLPFTIHATHIGLIILRSLLLDQIKI
ncbi:hypothetical protein AKJ16_DCAP26243 [Drosera capensis]